MSAVADRLLTPSKITAWLECAHFLTLRNRVDDGLLAEPDPKYGSFAGLLVAKGNQHERECLAEYARQGKSIREIPAREQGEPFTDWVARVGNPFDAGWDVIYQMPFVHDGMRGIADFVVRVEDPETGAVSYEPVDAKLTRVEAKPGHVLQLCFYAEAIEALTGVRPRRMHLWLGSGRVEALTVDEFSPYWRRLRGQLARALAAGPVAGTVPEPCPHCTLCEFFELCTTQWRDEDSLVYVAGIRQPERAVLNDGGVSTLAQLAAHRGPLDGIRPERLVRLVDQASLQVEARSRGAGAPPYTVIEAGDDPEWGHGWELLPAPDAGDVFLDFEGHPFWRPDAGLFFLFGLLERDPDDRWRYRAWWAHDLDQEAAAVTELIDFLDTRRAACPDAHAYHYNHTERSALERLTATHGVREVELNRLVETGFFVDLFAVARNAIRVGVESYGLKCLERLTTFQRGHDIDQGAGAVVEYERFMADQNLAALERIASYNEDDVRAAQALRDWLIEHRPAGTPWRAAQLEADPGIPELDEQVTRLHAFGPDTAEHLLGDVLGYWLREWRAYIAPKMAKCQADPMTLFDDGDVLSGLYSAELVERIGKRGKPILPVMRFTFPAQVADGFPSQGGQVVYLTPDGIKRYATIAGLDRDTGQLDLVWNDGCQQSGYVPSVVVVHDWVDTKPKARALSEFAARLVDHGGPAPNAVTAALLRCELPRFTPGGGPADGTFSDDLAEMTGWVTQLDHSYVAIQGPPGAGKTYSAAHLVHTLITAGQRVGITAMSHAAIDHLLAWIVKVFGDAGMRERLCAVRKPGSEPGSALPGVIYVDNNKRCARGEFNLVAGTTWLFASPDMRAAPVDVLLVDESGQLALADALAASCSARNLILLGDPLQLPQVVQADHPGGGGRSALEHVLGDDVTLPPHRGVFLSQTWRMHDDVCSFISEQIYGGRLISHPSCAQQTTVLGTGLRWLAANHRGNSTRSPEEADLIAAEIGRLIGTPWTNQKGEEKPLTAVDFMVVAPYNDQVRCIRDRLARDAHTAGVPVGTVDKFQGQEAAVVFFSMATSTGEDMTRGADFLFSRNRLNVAISRARCLAYLVCTEELLNTRARTVDDMRLIATLNAFVERAPRLR
ncbi:hypothetical protein BMW24_001305 [Mycobacterium heckeshornense]|nr:hypothetical protein BMW24_001305 [Mycobacterium heckeshornense]